MNAAVTSSLAELDLRFLDHLENRGRSNSIALERLHRLLDETSDRLAAVVLKLGLLAEDDLARAFVEFSELPLLRMDQLPRDAVAVGDLNVAFLRTREIAPIAIDAERLQVACWDPLDEYAVQALQFASGLSVVRFVTTRSTVLAALDALYPARQAILTGASASTGAHEDEEIDRLKDLASEAPVIRWVQRVINAAVAAKASDIHLEPSSEALHVRLRTDGLLREQERQSKDLGASVISRIKVMAGLNIAERRLPQDGRIRLTVQGKEIDFRVATSPTLHGESVVLRILDRDARYRRWISILGESSFHAGGFESTAEGAGRLNALIGRHSRPSLNIGGRGSRVE